MIKIGAHFSIAGGLHKAFDHADKYQCNSMQIFTQNSNTWKVRNLQPDEIETFLKRKEQSGVTDIIAHAGYLINLAGPEKEKQEKSYESMKGEMLRAALLGIENLVIHPGSHVKTSVIKGIERIAEQLNLLFDEKGIGKTKILLETTAGQGDSIGHTPESLEEIIKRVDNKDRIGICIDTCHIFAAGYDIRSANGYKAFVEEVEQKFGTDAVKCIHLNDSKKDLGSKVDRHEHIGEGFIGETGFELIMNDKRFAGIPKIIELPDKRDDVDMTLVNFKKLKSMAG